MRAAREREYPILRHHIHIPFNIAPLRRAGSLGGYNTTIHDLALGCGIVEIFHTSLEDACAAASSAAMGNADAECSARLGV